ncbi:hypothetical protein [Histidinibacterium aquaticum]|uniref:DUF3619 family protein n=1 Tax=Histidinibacterium aquaticum TaxID=2613962 RepID=A0A5J5GPI5_9RHOB|nr:hypothetical protein [Histidinibacterium aquaticum]KAA9010296.1 hypothetical protein F3S47_03345 [Histidinibacterium aquaticum]
MSDTQRRPFEQRVKRIEKRHRQINEYGADPRLTRDGLIVVKARRRMRRFPWRALLLVPLLAFALKAGLYLHLGPEDWAERLAALDPEDPVDRAGAFVLQPDPATLWIAEQVDRAGG